MSLLKRLWPVGLLALLAPGVHADDTSSAARKPAPPAAATPAPKPANTTKPPAPGADDELLEFLGSVGEESDGEWIDYLSKTDISKAAGAKPKTVPPAKGE